MAPWRSQDTVGVADARMTLNWHFTHVLAANTRNRTERAVGLDLRSAVCSATVSHSATIAHTHPPVMQHWTMWRR
eukprot:5330661-Pyramimonas_sp.AAC.1